MCSSKSFRQHWSPKCSSSYVRWYKYTSSLSGTEKSFYALTQLDVLVSVIAVLMCQTTLELLHSLPVVNMQHLCLLCFQWVDHSLMPSDKHHGSHHRQVSNRVAYNGETHLLCYWGTQCSLCHEQRWTKNDEETCHTWPLNWTLLAFGSYSTVIYLSLLLSAVKKKNN